MKKMLTGALLALVCGSMVFANGASDSSEKEWKPSQPITIMNHVAVGVAMDATYTKLYSNVKYLGSVKISVQ